ncbi:hypothetical protein [Bordetella sp. LUAb4]|uniref:hypothetical protein n=1 Tax=Bordetella sp. LUAb4 TaxID=2843195 RepID=UPI001E497B20|nr:hypothetical protein [Bordetella sp. LUAb4]
MAIPSCAKTDESPQEAPRGDWNFCPVATAMLLAAGCSVALLTEQQLRSDERLFFGFFQADQAGATAAEGRGNVGKDSVKGHVGDYVRLTA